MFFVLILGTLLIDAYILDDVRRALRRVTSPGRRRALRWLARIQAYICWIFLIVTLSQPRRSDADILPVMWCLYAYLTVYVPKLIFVVFSLLGRIPMLFRKHPLRLGLYAGLPLGVLVFAAMWWGAFPGRNRIQINEVEIFSERLPQRFDGYRIVQFSDGHVGTWGTDTAFVSRMVDSINSLRPDLIVFTGDIVNRRTEEILPFVKILSRLNAPDGVISVLGNHDYGDYMNWPSPAERESNNRLLSDIERRMGWQLLNNEHRFISRDRDSIAVIGVENWGEPPFRQYGRLYRAYSFSADSADNVYDSRFKILLTHNPEHWRREVVYKSNIDLTLSGHTHAMQFIVSLGRWRWSPSQYIYEQWGGLYSKTGDKGQEMKIYVNIGCGEVGMPYRIGADPEITLLILKRPQTTAK